MVNHGMLVVGLLLLLQMAEGEEGVVLRHHQEPGRRHRDSWHSLKPANHVP